MTRSFEFKFPARPRRTFARVPGTDEHLGAQTTEGDPKRSFEVMSARKEDGSVDVDQRPRTWSAEIPRKYAAVEKF